MHLRSRSVLILEDDACFCSDFAEKAVSFLQSVPDDWGEVMLGGQHRMPPEPVLQNVVRPVRCFRSHARAFRGAHIERVYEHLCDWPGYAQDPKRNSDQRMELMQANPDNKIYAPAQWLVGQSAGASDIDKWGRSFPDRFWHHGGINGKAK